MLMQHIVQHMPLVGLVIMSMLEHVKIAQDWHLLQYVICVISQ